MTRHVFLKILLLFQSPALPHPHQQWESHTHKLYKIYFCLLSYFFIYPICRILPAAKHDAGLRATQTPRAKLAAWIASQNYVLLFSQHLQARQSHHTFRSSRQLSFAHSRPTPFRPIFYRAPHFPAPTTSLPAPAGNSPSPHIFPY